MEALIIVDVQNDFLPCGALAVPEGDQVIPVINNLIEQFACVVATRDWHPPDHVSFASRHSGCSVGDVVDIDGVAQVLWPNHCVQHTPGAALAAGLNTQAIERVFDKGIDAAVDSYSGFLDAQGQPATPLRAYLQQKGATRVAIVGLALDYCVKQTALDAAALGFATKVILEGTRAVQRCEGDGAAALAAMRDAGVTAESGSG